MGSLSLLFGTVFYMSMYLYPSLQQMGERGPPGVPPVTQTPPVPQHSGQAGGYHGGGFGQEQIHDADHIKEHLKTVIEKPKEEMTEEELEFHYFKLHDYDSNNKLDGTEITKAITHFHDDEDGESKHASKVFQDHEIANIVDMVLEEDDLNKDGYIEYPEFVNAQRKAKTAQAQGNQ